MVSIKTTEEAIEILKDITGVRILEGDAERLEDWLNDEDTRLDSARSDGYDEGTDAGDEDMQRELDDAYSDIDTLKDSITDAVNALQGDAPDVADIIKKLKEAGGIN